MIWLVLKLDHLASLPMKTLGTLTKSSLLLIPSHLSHSGRNSAKWPFWPATPSGTLDRSRPGALKINRCSAPDFPSILALPSLLLGSFLNFFASHLLLLYIMFLCVYSPASKQALGLTSRPGLKCASFCHAFCSCCLQCLNKGWYNNVGQNTVHYLLFIYLLHNFSDMGWPDGRDSIRIQGPSWTPNQPILNTGTLIIEDIWNNVLLLTGLIIW